MIRMKILCEGPQFEAMIGMTRCINHISLASYPCRETIHEEFIAVGVFMSVISATKVNTYIGRVSYCKNNALHVKNLIIDSTLFRIVLQAIPNNSFGLER